eukprot:1176540-Pyramimonas_sp.AAC.1
MLRGSAPGNGRGPRGGHVVVAESLLVAAGFRCRMKDRRLRRAGPGGFGHLRGERSLRSGGAQVAPGVLGQSAAFSRRSRDGPRGALQCWIGPI